MKRSDLDQTIEKFLKPFNGTPFEYSFSKDTGITSGVSVEIFGVSLTTNIRICYDGKVWTNTTRAKIKDCINVLNSFKPIHVLKYSLRTVVKSLLLSHKRGMFGSYVIDCSSDNILYAHYVSKDVGLVISVTSSPNTLMNDIMQDIVTRYPNLSGGE